VFYLFIFLQIGLLDVVGVYCVHVAWDIKEPLLDTGLGQRLLLSVRVRNGCGTHPVARPMGTEGCVVVKRQSVQVHHSPLSSSEFKYVLSRASILPCVFLAWCLIKHRARFKFLCQFFCCKKSIQFDTSFVQNIDFVILILIVV
jgi:hypothetical protein